MGLAAAGAALGEQSFSAALGLVGLPRPQARRAAACQIPAVSWQESWNTSGTLQTAEPQPADVGGQPSRLQSPSAPLQLCSCSSPVLFGHVCGADPALPRHWGFEPGQMGCSGL